MTDHITTAVVLALAIGAGAFTATKTHISMPLRTWIAKRGKSNAFMGKMSQLVNCPYCLSHWLAFGAVLIYRPWLISGEVVGRFLVTSLAIVAGASAVVLIIKKALS